TRRTPRGRPRGCARGSRGRRGEAPSEPRGAWCSWGHGTKAEPRLRFCYGSARSGTAVPIRKMPPAASARHPSPAVVLAVLAMGAMSYALLQSLVVPALPAIQQDLHTSATGAAWVMTAYLLSASVATPIAGRLG